MQNDDCGKLRATLIAIQQMLLQSISVSPSGHDLLNSVQTIGSSIEILNPHVTPKQRQVFDRLTHGAQQLEEQIKALKLFIEEQAALKKTVLENIDAALSSSNTDEVLNKLRPRA